jgi:hypothetical protein
MQSRRFLVGISLLLLSGCATSGRDWVLENPEMASNDVAPATNAREAFENEPTPANAEEVRSLDSENGVPAPTENTNQVITLGETTSTSLPESGPPAGDEGASEGAGAPSVQVNNNYYGGYGYGYGTFYGGYGYGWGGGGRGDRSGRDSGDRGRRTNSSVQPGQSWPAVPDYGPAFPFRTAPANPWAPAR